MTNSFELATGTGLGAIHLRRSSNNQDTYFYSQSTTLTLAIVADGCGSQPHSEVGAQIGVRSLARHLRVAVLGSSPSFNSRHWWDEVLGQVVADLRSQAWLLATDHTDWVEYLLFTLVGCIITADQAVFFSYGDGLLVVNGELIAIEYPDNAPPYLGYQLAGRRHRFDDFVIWRQVPTDELNSFIVATDGLRHLLNATGQTLPGKTEPVVAVEQFWQSDRFFTNPEALHRYLTLAGREVKKLDRATGQLITHPSLLPDDTTVIVGRRKESTSHDDSTAEGQTASSQS